MISSLTKSCWLSRVIRDFATLRILAAISMAVFLLASQYGCLASRSDISAVENRTSEIQESLDRLQQEMDQRLRAVEKFDGKYDYSNSLLMDTRALDRIINSIVTIQTQTLFEASQTSEPIVRESTGVGVVVGSYVLTLNHVVTQNNLEVDTPFGRVSLPSKKLEEKAHLVFHNRKLILKEVLKDPELDIALFEIPTNDLNLASLACPVGNSDELMVGTFLYVVGNPLNSGINMREGIVSSVLGLEGIAELSARRSDLFVISNGVLPGDSGGVVLALRDGVPELVGLVQGTIGMTRIGWAIKINSIRKVLAKPLNGEEFCVVQREASHRNQSDLS